MFRELDKTYIISELGINANGDINLAKEMIKASKEGGADCVKLQKRDIELVYTQEVLNSPRPSKWGTTVREQKRGLEFTDEQYFELKSYADEVGIAFTASPWDVNSLASLVKLGVPFIKIPSALATNKAYLRACAETKLPLVLSTGMCSKSMINAIAWFLADARANLQVILHCVSTYPTSIEEMNLSGIKTLQELFYRTNYVIGHSGHDELIISSALAVAMGAKVIERHFTMDRNLEGTDQKSSLEPKDFAEMVRQVRVTEKAMGKGKILITKSEEPIIKKLRLVDDFQNINFYV